MEKDLLTISQEMFDLGKTQDVSGFTKLFSDLGANFRSVFSQFTANRDSDDGIDLIGVAIKQFRDDHADEQYQQVRNMNAYVPPGFKGRLADYAQALQEACTLAGDLEATYYVPTKRYLAELLADPERAKGVTVPLQDIKGSLIDEALAKTKPYFKNTMRTDQARFGEVYANLKDLDVVADRLIAAHTLIRRLAPEQARQHAQETANIIDKLIIRMKQKPELYNINGMSAENLGAMVHTLARATEFYGAIQNELRIVTLAYVETLE